MVAGGGARVWGMAETAVVPWDGDGSAEYRQRVESAGGTGGKFDEARRQIYLGYLRMGTPSSTAARRAGVSPVTVERYGRAMGDVWRTQVREAVEESLDPIRLKRRELALEGQPWAIDREIGKGRDSGGNGRAALAVEQGVDGSMRVGVLVEGGEEGINSALTGVLDQLRERRAVLAEAEG